MPPSLYSFARELVLLDAAQQLGRLIGLYGRGRTQSYYIFAALERLITSLAADRVTLQKMTIILSFLQRQLQLHPVSFIYWHIDLSSACADPSSQSQASLLTEVRNAAVRFPKTAWVRYLGIVFGKCRIKDTALAWFIPTKTAIHRITLGHSVRNL